MSLPNKTGPQKKFWCHTVFRSCLLLLEINIYEPTTHRIDVLKIGLRNTSYLSCHNHRNGSFHTHNNVRNFCWKKICCTCIISWHFFSLCVYNKKEALSINSERILPTCSRFVSDSHLSLRPIVLLFIFLEFNWCIEMFSLSSVGIAIIVQLVNIFGYVVWFSVIFFRDIRQMSCPSV